MVEGAGAVGIAVDQLPGAAGRGVGDAAHQFRVVAPAEALVGVGPRPVVREIAERVCAQVQRLRAEQAAVVGVQRDVRRLPAQCRRHRAVALRRRQEGVAEEGRAGDVERVPKVGRNVVDGAVESAVHRGPQGRRHTLASHGCCSRGRPGGR
ncbi:hypothetical protein D3C72_1794970 [compost metagenome]